MPHLSLPLQLATNGSFATVAQDSAADVAQSLGVLLATRPGERVTVPTYGTPDPQADGPDLTGTQGAIAHWEPRAGAFDITLTVDGENVTVDIEADS